MTKEWYPIVNTDRCTQCGFCINFCPRNVYDKSRGPVPTVTYPEGCVDHCHGCGKRCPNGAITYNNDDTGWIPPRDAIHYSK